MVYEVSRWIGSAIQSDTNYSNSGCEEIATRIARWATVTSRESYGRSRACSVSQINQAGTEVAVKGIGLGVADGVV